MTFVSFWVVLHFDWSNAHASARGARETTESATRFIARGRGARIFPEAVPSRPRVLTV